MKCVDKAVLVGVAVMTLILSLHLFGHDVFAAEKSSSWRPTYDLILRWINFGIIVFLVYKYARVPVMNFLKGQKQKLADEIEKLENEKNIMVEKVEETKKALDESEVRFRDLQQRIVQQGERRKQDIVESAKNQSRIMLEEANRKVESYMLSAKSALKAELIDAAVEMAMEKLPKEITEQDNEEFIAQYLSSASIK
jgi:F-type H+-transporting ATPase subunit b